MRIQYLQAHSNALVEIEFAPGEAMIARPESVLATNQSLTLTKQSMNADFARHQAGEQPTTLWLTPSFSGFLQDIPLEPDGLKVRKTNLIAYSEDIIASHYEWPGFETHSGKPQDWLTLTGEGTALVSGFGSLYPMQIDGKCLLNPQKIVAMQGRVSFIEEPARPTRWQRLTGMCTLSCCFYGAGTLWCQSHHPTPLAEQLAPRLRRHRSRARRVT